MSQKIKKQIKRSMPLFLIFSLLWTSMAIGLVFNFDLSIYKNNKLDISLETPEVLADTATTTVNVLNASPYFAAGPYEWPVSSTSRPINVGDDIRFEASASDPELDNYYLLVCGDATGQANNGGAPSCSGEQFCVSGATGTGASSTCSYTVSDPGGETDVWYAYVCDAHATEAACSAVDQGTGDGGSPFYVNHAPTIDLIITSDNDKGPGGTFTVTASSTDSDVAGGADTIEVYICATNSWATSTGCASPLCSATSTISGGITATSCQFTVASVIADQDYTYYGFIHDTHYFAGTNNGTSTSYTVINEAPSVSSVTINGGKNIYPNLKNATEYVASSTATATDNNGCADLSSATSSLYWESVSGGANCTADDNNCYRMTTSCTQDVGSCIGANANYTCTTTIAFHAVPTDINAWTASNTMWYAGFTAIDDNNANGSGVSVSGVEVATVSALEVTEGTLNYGTMNAGQDTGNDNATSTVVNFGNSPIDVDVQANDDMLAAGGYFILADQQEWSLSAPFNWSTGTALASTSASTVDTVIARPTNQSDVSDEIYWGIGLPVTTHSGDYTGSTTFAVVIDPNGTW